MTLSATRQTLKSKLFATIGSLSSSAMSYSIHLEWTNAFNDSVFGMQIISREQSMRYLIPLLAVLLFLILVTFYMLLMAGLLFSRELSQLF